jgi:hypothetical protein
MCAARIATGSLVLLLICTLQTAAPGQDVIPPMVTSVSSSGAATARSETGETSPVAFGMLLFGEQVDVASDQELMLYSPSGRAVLIIRGPASFATQVADQRLLVQFSSGRLMATSPTSQNEQPVTLVLGPKDSPLVEAALGQGSTCAFAEADRVELAYVARAETSMSVVVRSEPRTLASGQLLTAGPTTSVGPADAWLSENGFDVVESGQRMAVGSARTSRLIIQDRLFSDVVSWDRLAQASAIIPTLELDQFKPEIRTVAAAVQTTVQNTTNRGNSPQTPTVQGANEVPTLSPAAVSVGGVTAVTINNQNAANLLTRTQSRGLGFNGPSQLAIPGFRNGVRTLGPSGLGARP